MLRAFIYNLIFCVNSLYKFLRIVLSLRSLSYASETMIIENKTGTSLSKLVEIPFQVCDFFSGLLTQLASLGWLSDSSARNCSERSRPVLQFEYTGMNCRCVEMRPEATGKNPRNRGSLTLIRKLKIFHHLNFNTDVIMLYTSRMRSRMTRASLSTAGIRIRLLEPRARHRRERILLLLLARVTQRFWRKQLSEYDERCNRRKVSSKLKKTNPL